MVDVGQWLTENEDLGSAGLGLFITGDAAKAVPLRSRHVRVALHCDLAFAETTEELSYLADADATVSFKFPVPSRAAVYRFEATIGDRKVVTETKRKAEAEAEYAAATQQGHTAVLAKQAGGSIYSVELGNLEAHTECVIRLSYLRQLDRAAGVLEYVHTATWVPPYVGAAELSSGSDTVEAMNPKFASRVSYSLMYDVTVNSAAPPTSITSPSHDDLLTSTMEVCSSGFSVPRIRASKEVSDPSLDFVLLVELAEDAADAAGSRLDLQRCTRSGKQKLMAQATFVPRPAHGAGEELLPAPRELWLVIDGSGSMGGAPEVQARDAASFFVKDLPQGKGLRFNLVMFGSGHSMMWPEARDVTDATSKEAETWVQANVHSGWGGTEIHGALKAVFDVPISKGHSREIIFCTDGGISSCEEDRIKALVKSGGGGGRIAPVVKALRNLMPGGKEVTAKAPQQQPALGGTACHVLGIGHGIHRGFLDDVASLSGGVAQYVVDGEDVAVKAGFLKKCALSAGALSGPRLVTKKCLLAPAPATLPPRLFPGEPLIILAQVLKHEPGAAVGLKVTQADGSDIDIELPLDVENASESDAFAVLHAMSSVGALLDGRSALHLQPDGMPRSPPPMQEGIKEEVIRLATEENLVTPYTASVGVLLQSSPLDPSAMQRHEVPLQVPHGRKLWQDRQASHEALRSAPFPFACQAPSGAPQAFLAAGGAAPMARCTVAPKKSRGFGFGGGSLFGSGAARSAALPCMAMGTATASALGVSASPSVSVPPPAAAPPSPVASPVPMQQGPAQPPGGGLGTQQSSNAGFPAAQAQAAVDVDAVLSRGERLESLAEGMAALQQSAANFRCAAVPGGGILAACKPALDEAAAASAEETAAACAMEAEASAPRTSSLQDTRSVLRQLNLLRTADGAWADSDELLSLLASLKPLNAGGAETEPQGVAVLRAAKPKPVDNNAWATVLALAALRARLRAEQALWSDWEARATVWLKAHWPPAAGSVGVAIIQAMKLV